MPILLSTMFLSFYVSIVLYFPLLPPLPSNLSFIQAAPAIQLLRANPLYKIQRAEDESRFNYTEHSLPSLSPKCTFFFTRV